MVIKAFIIAAALLTNFHAAYATDDIERLRMSIEATTDAAERALLYKKTGDYYISMEDYKKAADVYIKALSSAREVFSIEERIQIAVYISWADMLKEAIEELKAIIAEDPDNMNARIHYARTLSWTGRLKEAVEEADAVLEVAPENRDALLIKANALSWGGNYKSAIPIYQGLLEKEDDFDARLGLANALVASGDLKGAREVSENLQPQYSYQDRGLEGLQQSLKRAEKERAPFFGAGYSYYNDSDFNQYNKYSLFYGFSLDTVKLEFNYKRIDARDSLRNNSADDLWFKVSARLTESVSMGWGIGAYRFRDGDSSFLAGYMRGESAIPNGSIRFDISRDAIAETAQLIENGIRMTSANVSVSQNIGSDISLHGGYNYRHFSDDNSASGVLLMPRLKLYNANPIIHIGYRFRYLDFERQSRGGYFDPDTYVSHQVLFNFYYYTDGFYVWLEPYYGHQLFDRYGSQTSDFIEGGALAIGYNLLENTSVELNAEGGNYALGNPAGFKYYLVGLQIRTHFMR